MVTLIGSACYSLIPLFLQKTINALTTENSIYSYLLVMVFLYFIYDTAISISTSYTQVLTVEIGNKLGEKYIKFLSFMPILFFIEMGSAKLNHILQSAKAGLSSILQSFIHSILPTIIQLSIAISILIYSDDYYVVYSISIYFLLYSLLSFFMVRKIARIYMDTILTNIENSKSINILISNIETIKIFNAKNFAIDNYRKSQTNLLCKWIRYSYSHYKMESLRIILFTILIVFILVNSANRYVSNEITIGHFVMLNTYIFQVCKPFENFIKSLGGIVESIIGTKPLSDILKSKDDAIIYRIESRSKSLLKSDVVLRIKNLYFKYPKRNNYTLSNLNLDFEKGKVIGITGMSGTGKTTLLSILLKLNIPNSGEILLNGIDINHYNDSDYYENICLISQDSGVFNESLSFNLRIANPSATDEMLKTAINLACLDDLYLKLPNGLDSYLGERGLQLSGGERQRLNIARSFLRDFEIIFYDESTSSLDEATAETVLDNIVSFHKNKTIVFITHHDIPLSYCDEVIKLQVKSAP